MAEYAVSRGNGNDGVSRLHPNYVVTTDEPWVLAELAAISEFKRGYGRKWCRANLNVDGEAKFGISSTLFDPPGRDGAGWCDANGAWRIWEIYPAEQVSDRSEAPRFDSLEAAFGAAMVRAQRKRH